MSIVVMLRNDARAAQWHIAQSMIMYHSFASVSEDTMVSHKDFDHGGRQSCSSNLQQQGSLQAPSTFLTDVLRLASTFQKHAEHVGGTIDEISAP